MIELQINDRKYKVPESFEELTLEQYCKCFYKIAHLDDDADEIERLTMAKRNEAAILSRLLGEADDFCLDIPLELFAHLAEATRWLYDADFFIRNSKASVRIDGKLYSVPPLDRMTMRQYIDADMVMKEESDHQFIDLLSVLLLTHDEKDEWIPYDGGYEKMVPKVKGLSCADALPLVYHFFKKGQALNLLSRASMTEEESQLAHNTANS